MTTASDRARGLDYITRAIRVLEANADPDDRELGEWLGRLEGIRLGLWARSVSPLRESDAS